MDISEIMLRLPLPGSPKETDELEWDRIERALGVDLPRDYKDFVSIYGTGSIGHFLWVFNPSSKNRSLNGEAIRYFLTSYENLKHDLPADYIRPAFPSVNSFLPFAVTDNGDTLVWILNGMHSDSWKVGIMSSNQSNEEIFELGFVAFLVQLLDKKIVSSILPHQFLKADKKFNPLV